MVPDLHVAEALTIPSELNAQVPRRTRISGNCIPRVMSAVLCLAFGISGAYFLIRGAMQDEQTKSSLRRERNEATGDVTRIIKSRVDYRFTVNGATFTGQAVRPDPKQIGLRESDPIRIRFLPSNPAVNHPAAWEESPSIWFGVTLSLMVASGAMVPIAWLRKDRRLVAEGMPVIAVITNWTRGSKGGYYAHYEFQTQDGDRITGSGGPYEIAKEIAARMCVLYLPTNPRENQIYETLGYRAAQ